ncbi:hypothetical protein Esti_006336 [Eimeria stiedai]
MGVILISIKHIHTHRFIIHRKKVSLETTISSGGHRGSSAAGRAPNSFVCMYTVRRVHLRCLKLFRFLVQEKGKLHLLAASKALQRAATGILHRSRRLRRKRGRINVLTRAAWVGGLLISGVMGVLWFFQEKLVFYPEVPRGFETPDKNPRGLHNPGERNLPFEDVFIRTRDGLTLHGWLLPQPNAKQVPTFLYFHGNAGNIGFRLPNLELMFRLVGVNILIISYRGYGYSEGSPTEEGVYTDAEAALDFILENSTVNNKEIFAFGRSIGGAVAIECARRRGKELKGIIVENTFTSLLDMLYVVFPFLTPLRLLIRFVQRMYMKNDDKVRSLTLPFLFISGRQDELVPPWHMDRLFNACAARVKLREDVEEGGHNDTWEAGGESYYKKMRQFIEEALADAKANNNAERQMRELSSFSETSTLASTRQRTAIPDVDL